MSRSLKRPRLMANRNGKTPAFAGVFCFIIVPPENPLALADGMNGGLLSS
jgi:hypothetical protein